MRLIDADALEKEGWSLHRTYQKDKATIVYEVKAISEINTAQPDFPDTNVGDTISRQAAIDLINQHIFYNDYDDTDKCSLIDGLRELPSAQPEPQWIPCSERLPEDLEEVNVTWVNHDPEPYYNFVKDKPFTATAVYYKEKWYWYSSTCADLLAEYGRNPNQGIDDGIEIIAWMPLPEPYRAERRTDETD